MGKYLRVASLGGLLLVTAPCLSCSALDEEQKAVEFSCVSSIHATLASVDAKSNISMEATAEWRVLTDAEVAEYVSKASSGRKLDCGDVPTDSSRLHIAVRRQPQSARPEFLVWMNGPDGVSGTSDDVSSMPDARVPQTP